MVEIKINEKVVKVSNNLTILQACETAGVIVPRFCYHNDLSIAGNCRMCLVAISGSPKLVASCMMPISNGMHVLTDSTKVRQAQQGVMEHLLTNHPLDCPICDQGGECDLQDQAQFFGSSHGRFTGNKRAVEDKNVGPLIKTVMTRCIHCTRCIRFATEIAGLSSLGTMGRGRGTEVGSYVERLFQSELSGNVIDLCPVGALTAKPQAFYSRSWEAEKVEVVDPFDGLGSILNITMRGFDILRILPSKKGIKGNWISDKARFAYDGLAFQRLTENLIRVTDKFSVCNWLSDAYRIDTKQTITSAFLVGGLLGIEETQKIFNTFLKVGGAFFSVNNIFASYNVDQRSNFLTNVSDLNCDLYDCVLNLNFNPKNEAAVFLGRLRQRMTAGKLDIYEINGFSYDTAFCSAGTGFDTMLALVEGRHAFAKTLITYKNILLLKGSALNSRVDSGSVACLLEQFGSLFFGGPNKAYTFLQSNTMLCINTFHHSANEAFRLDLGLICKNFHLKLSHSSSNLLFQFDNANFPALLDRSKAFVFYFGSHFDVGAKSASGVFFDVGVFERSGSFMNTQGLVFGNIKIIKEKAQLSAV